MFNWNILIQHIGLVLFVLFAVFAAIQFYYYLRIFFPVLFYRSIQENSLTPLSVVICAKNEGENLKRNLKLILEQDHPNYEVIVVDDGSTDNTSEVIGEYLTEYKHLKTTSIPIPSDPKFSHGKKLAVTVGIKAAKNDWVVFTDADCYPDSTEWLSSLITQTDDKEIILGYGGYKREKSILNNYIRFETINIAFMYIGYALARKPYMGIGRNMAYKKQLFFKNKGFANNYGLLSGDDDLFVNETCNSKNTSVIINKESFTRSYAATTWRSFFRQKIRHLSTADKYKPMHSFRIGMEPISRTWFYFLLGILLFNNFFLIATLSIVAVRLIFQLIIYIAASHKFKEKNIWIGFIIFDVFSLFFNFLAYFALTFRPKQIKWR